MNHHALTLAVVSLTIVCAVTSDAQQPALTAADYARAERFLRDNVTPLVFGVGVQPVWISGNRFGYRIRSKAGNEIILVDPTRGTRGRCSPETARCGGGIEDGELSRAGG